jgi:hypothetical protein
MTDFMMRLRTLARKHVLSVMVSLCGFSLASIVHDHVPKGVEWLRPDVGTRPASEAILTVAFSGQQPARSRINVHVPGRRHPLDDEV